MSKTSGLAASLRQALLGPSCVHACVNGNGRRALTTSLETGHRLTAQLTERKGKNKIGAPAAAS